MIYYKKKAYGSIYLPQKVFDFLGTSSLAKVRVTSTRLKSVAEAEQNYMSQTLWSNNDLNLYKGSSLAKKLSHMPLRIILDSSNFLI
jgi:hypothetical protein